MGSPSHQNLDNRLVDNSHAELFRDKREVPAPEPNSNVKSSTSNVSNNQSPSQDASVELSSQQLLGVNGTGQRKDMSTSSEHPILAATISTSSKQLGISLSGEIPDDFGVDTIDQPDEDTNTTLKSHNITQFKTVSERLCVNSTSITISSISYRIITSTTTAAWLSIQIVPINNGMKSKII